jgi:hypothetical protein
MKIELTMQVRGGDRTIQWDDGTLCGDEEVIRRLMRLVDDGQVDLGDLLSVVRGTEVVTAQHVTIANLDLVEPEGRAPTVALA